MEYNQTIENSQIVENNKPESNRSLKFNVILIISILLLASNVFFVFQYLSIQKQMNEVATKGNINNSIVAFDRLFVEIVLKSPASGQVSYEDVLKLENAAVSTNDQEIVAQWHTFLNSSTEVQAQEATRDLLSLFANKISNN